MTLNGRRQRQTHSSQSRARPIYIRNNHYRVGWREFCKLMNDLEPEKIRARSILLEDWSHLIWRSLEQCDNRESCGAGSDRAENRQDASNQTSATVSRGRGVTGRLSVGDDGIS
jgi:hypothetical protein